jgi:hypothetical protein
VSNVEIARVLVQSGHQFDAVDEYGRTPPMYAAALGYSETVQFLICAKANLLIKDKISNLNFIGHASCRGNWDLIIAALKAVRRCYSPRRYERFAYYSVRKLLKFRNVKNGYLYFMKLINFLDNVNRINARTGDTLLHSVGHRDDAYALVRRGFTNFHHRNCDGLLPIHLAMYWRGGAELIEFFLNHGTDVNVTDGNGRTVMFYLVSQLVPHRDSHPTILSAINACLTHGANILSLDNCRCACSSNGGCIAVASCNVWRGDFGYLGRSHEFIRATELLCLLEEHGGEDLTKTLLLSLLRRKYFDFLEMTHICCHKSGVGFSVSHNPEPVEVDRILDEESEFTEQLDQEMERLEQQSLGYLWFMWMSISKVGYEDVRTQVQEMRESFKGEVSSDQTDWD